MSARRIFAGVLSATVAGASLALVTGGAAHAAVDPDDTQAFTPVSADLIGVGSDTSQNALFRLANAYNATTPTPTSRLFTYAATGGGTIALPDGTTPNRPNGSGAGKRSLYGATNLAEVDYARSSAELDNTEVNNGLQAIPFALDTLGVAVSGTTASNAPATLSEQQILAIYEGEATTWNQVGGTSNATIAPKIPQVNSGTRNFFLAELKRINGGTDVTLGSNVAIVQENDATPLQSDANAIAPFSIGRAGLEGSKLRVPSGFAANRALYNVVRGTDLTKTEIQKAFGPTGYVCSDAARSQIEAAGFKQLATAERNGVCGEATTAKTTDFTINTGPPVSDDPEFIPESADLIGVGSDTSQHALALLADGYNTRTPAPDALLASYAATGGGQIQLPDGTVINRPNGSGAGKRSLYGATNQPEIDYARSSAELDNTEVNNGLQAFPFALDTLGVAVSGTTASNAPATLSEEQILAIYEGEATTWNQVGGTSNATIAPKIPQVNSGTRNFFLAELKRINGGTDVTLGSNVAIVQENDPAPLQDDANAIAPFSVGRAGLEGTKLRVPSGFAANRALYNVVRGTDLGDAEIQDVFGTDGYLCSDAARPLIEQAGFKQLARPDDDGVCGEATTAKTTNFETNEPAVTVPTTMTLSGSSPAARALRLTARVNGTPTPTGTVQFFRGTTSLGTANLQGGVATLNKPGQVPGAATYRAVYTPTAETDFVGSEDTVSARVKAASAIRESFPTSTRAATVRGVVTVSFTGLSTRPTGRVTLKEGSRTVGTGVLRSGRVTMTLSRAKLGYNRSTVRISYPGNGYGFGSSKAFFVTFARARR